MRFETQIHHDFGFFALHHFGLFVIHMIVAQGVESPMDKQMS